MLLHIVWTPSTHPSPQCPIYFKGGKNISGFKFQRGSPLTRVNTEVLHQVQESGGVVSPNQVRNTLNSNYNQWLWTIVNHGEKNNLFCFFFFWIFVLLVTNFYKWHNTRRERDWDSPHPILKPKYGGGDEGRFCGGVGMELSNSTRTLFHCYPILSVNHLY